MEQKDVMIDELSLRIAETTKELMYWKSMYALLKKEIETKKPSELISEVENGSR